MSTIHFSKNEKKKLIRYIKKYSTIDDYNDEHTLKLKKTYNEIYSILTLTQIFPNVINNLINDYLTDIMIFTVDTRLDDSNRPDVQITTNNVRINFKNYKFSMLYSIIINDTDEYENDDDVSITTLIDCNNNNIYKARRGINCIPFFNYYMNKWHNKTDYMHYMPSDKQYWHKYIDKSDDVIERHYPDRFFEIQKTKITIKNHEMLTTTIVMLKLITSAIYNCLKN